MDNDLERSVRLLEDALAIPSKGIFKSANKSKNKSRQIMDSTSNDFTMGLTEEEAREILQWQTYENTMTILMDSNKSLMGSVIQSQTPWKSTTNNLYLEFADILQSSGGGSEILDVAADLARCCSDTLSVVQRLKEKSTESQTFGEKWLEDERNTWRLLYVLYQDRLHAQNSLQEDLGPQYLGTSEKTCVDLLFKRDHLIRESQLIVDWLEKCALERDDPILHRSDWTFGWENTMHQLLAPDTIAFGSSVDMVKNIYPDAPQFEGGSLHHLDLENERQLCKRIFVEIRCGKLEDAQELCSNCGHPWRAAMLEGWKLFHNPNVKDQEVVDEEDSSEDSSRIVVEETYEDVEGNISRDLWKSTSIEYCKQNGLNVYDRAAVASLCGHLETLVTVSESWEDYLWAYMRTMVDIRVESEIRDCIVRNYVPLPEEYWEQKMSLDEIFNMLESSKCHTVSAQAKEQEHIIQKHIILDEIPKLIKLLDQWCEDIKISTHSLRFFAHLIVFFDHVGEAADRKSCEKIIEAYITRLSEMNETQLVAYYVSKLERRKQIILYAAHLEKILNNDQRKEALAFAEDCSIDVLAVTKTIVESIRSRPSDVENTGNLHHKVTEADEVKISALDWLIFYPAQRLEALVQTNALIFKFLTLGKTDAAQLALNKIPSDSIERILSEGQVSEDANQTIKEFLSYKAYLDAHEAFTDWFKQYQNKPTPPQPLGETAQFTEKVAHQHRVSQFNAELERWRLTTGYATKVAKTLLYNVLLFPQGWLVGAEDGDYLRSECVPEVVLLLYTILSESGAHEEAVQLADVIAAERNGIYKVYSKEKMAEILEKMCESSVALLNAKKDPWGNPTSA